MSIVSSFRWRPVSAFIWFSVPLSVFQVLLLTPSAAGEWVINERAIQHWGVASFLVCLILYYGIKKGLRFSYYLSVVYAFFWCGYSILTSFNNGGFALIVLTLFLVLYWWLVCGAIRHEVERSFFDSRLSWYQGLPLSVPGLMCGVGLDGDHNQKFKVCRLDEEGAFIFFPALNFRPKMERYFLKLKKTKKIDLVITYKNLNITCSGRLERILRGGSGAGIRFLDMSLDSQKKLMDFMEQLRGVGYVN